MIQQLLKPKPLSELRDTMGISQRKLANLLSKNDGNIKFSQSTIARYESGTLQPSLKRAKLIAEFFQMPIEAIIFGPFDYSEQYNLTGTE